MNGGDTQFLATGSSPLPLACPFHALSLHQAAMFVIEARAAGSLKTSHGRTQGDPSREPSLSTQNFPDGLLGISSCPS